MIGNNNDNVIIDDGNNNVIINDGNDNVIIDDGRQIENLSNVKIYEKIINNILRMKIK